MRGAGGRSPRPLVFWGSAPKDVVQAAAPESGEVERHPGEPEPPELLDDGGAARRLEQSRDVVGGDLDARDAVVKSDAQLTEPELAEKALRRRDAREPLVRDRGPVREAGRKAGTRRPVPRREPERAARCAHVLLREARLDQRVADAAVGRGLEAGPMVAQVVDVRAVDDDGDAAPLRLRGADREEIVLAEPAPVRRVRGVAGNLQLVRVDDDVLDAERRGELLRGG